MKLVDTTCPHCGSVLKVYPTNKNAKCEYCGATLLIDDGVVHVQYDNAEEAGYKFEKGRQRAIAEAKTNNSLITQRYVQPKKKSRTWIWVIGWICIFPIPLTILLLRKKDMKPNIKYGVIAAAWVIYLIIGIYANFRNPEKKPTEQSSINDAVEVPQSTNDAKTESSLTTTPETDSSKENDSHVEDFVVNRFITEFNYAYEDDIHDISKGNIRTKYFGYIRNTRIEMINSNENAVEAFSVSIYGGQEEVDRDAMFEVFKEVVKILEPSVTDNDISGKIDHFISGDIAFENNQLGKTLNLTYIPITELSYGKTECRIDILAFDYKDRPSDATLISETVEMNDLQSLFASLTTGTSREDINTFIEEKGLVKYAFTHDSAYYIGYENSAIRQRGRDREGEALDINFNTSGDSSRIGLVSSAEYAIHTGMSTHTALKYKDGIFYYEGEACSSGEEAMQKFLKLNK